MSLDFGIFDGLASGLMGGGAAVTVSLLLLRRSLQETDGRLRRLERERKECQEKCEARFADGERQFARLDKDIIRGINEIKVQIARLEGGGDLAKELGRSLRRFAGKGKR